ncbi:MAG: hypothetical protein ABSF98_19270 [Bryobacteraceae bacterium]
MITANCGHDPDAPIDGGDGAFKRRLDDIFEGLRRESFEQDCGRTVYHYTSPKGLAGIIKSGQLWATSIRHFRDQSELKYAETVYEEVREELEKSTQKAGSTS